MRLHALLGALLALAALGALAAPQPGPDPLNAAYTVTWEKLLPGDKDLTLSLETWDGKFRVAMLANTGLASADVTGLTVGKDTISGKVLLTLAPADPKVDKPVPIAMDVSGKYLETGALENGGYQGKRGDVQVTGKCRGVMAARPVSNVGVFSGGRHGDFSRKAAQGDHMKVAVATFFGSADNEEFIDAGCLADGGIVAFGNATGPRFPDAPAPTVLGKGAHTGWLSVRSDTRFDPASPDTAGFIAIYSADATKLHRVLKLDWGVATLSTGIVTNDGTSLIIAGRCGKAFATFSALTDRAKTLPHEAPAPPTNPKVKPVDPATQKDVFVAEMAPDGKVAWIWVLERANVPPPDIYCDNAGAVYCDIRGLRRISPDGAEMTLISTKANTGTAKWLGVDPKDGGVYYGGDRNTHTGQQPYRQPYFYKYDTEGKKVYTLWEPDPKTVGSATGGLESDSSPRGLAWAKDGTMIVTGWSDGGNSVFPRQALDWHKPAAGGGMGIATWGMKNANSLGHIMLIDPKTQETKAHTWWASFIPTWFSSASNRGAPNFINIDQVKVLADGSVAVAGQAATGLIQTPDPFWTDPRSGDRHGGKYISVFKPDLTNLRFSSLLPGCDNAALGATKDGGLIVVSSSSGKDMANTPTLTPSKNALQSTCAGGVDGHLVLLVP